MKKEFSHESQDGAYPLHTLCWLPDHGSPRAVVLIVHGIGEHIERYDHFASFLMEAGYAVFGFDLPGHGHSAAGPEDYGYFADADGWTTTQGRVQELAQLLKEGFAGLPLFLLGHSMGSFLVRSLMIQRPDLADGVILSGTGQPPNRHIRFGLAVTKIACRILGPRARSRHVQSLVMGSYNRQFAPARTSADWISRDTDVVDRYVADPLSRYIPTVSLFRDLLGGLLYLGDERTYDRIRKDMPLFILSGDQDPVGENGVGVRRVFDSYDRAGCQNIHFQLYPEGRHEMLNELNRDEVYEDILTWLNTQTEAQHGVS